MKFWCNSAILLFGIIVFVNGKIKVLDGNDPGSCDKSNKGDVMLVRDRQDKQKLLICTNDNGVFQWRAIDGSTPPGELFNPAYDCSEILDKDAKAKDGFYWIRLNGSEPIKVWCDMKTDGGGFMLIGRKNNSVTWTVPSNNSPVKPFGKPHWSSALGDVPILDFRVQMATSEDFKETKAHWSYRLKAKRPLKNLMIINRGGCDRTSPGIGNIAYVKDLLTDDIVTTTFRCSKFGIAYHRLTMFGWSMMNSCLQKPCRWGFAFHHKLPIQTDYSGAFSYSVTRGVSGIEHPATAFVGCDNGYCCGCFGPKGGKKDYCSKECHSKNGGKISKNVFTWFWVRSSLPKKMWSKCMEYKVLMNGKMVWNKLEGGSVLPTQGRCAKNDPLLYDGILVVSDNVTARKVPLVPGLMVYRKDNKRLYINGNKTWNVIAQEKKILEKTNALIKPKLTEVKKKLENQDKKLTSTLNKDIAQLEKQMQSLNRTLAEKLVWVLGYSSSVILSGKPNYAYQLNSWLPAKIPRVLCYRASRDGWNSRTFHSKCDNKGATVTIIRVGTYIFGGYADYSWSGSYGYRSSSSSFIFSLQNKDNLAPFKAPVYRYSNRAIYSSYSYGPTFGGGHDINIKSYAHSSTNSYTNFGYTYRPPSGYGYGQYKTQALLAGSYKFKPSEIEVFY